MLTKVLIKKQELTLAPCVEHYGLLHIGDQIRRTCAACKNMLTVHELLGQPLVLREGGGPTDTAQKLPTAKIWSM